MKTNPNDSATGLPGEFILEVGLTKREEFAKVAMQGLCAGPFMDDLSYQELAACAVQQADALIDALNKDKTYAS